MVYGISEIVRYARIVVFLKRTVVFDKNTGLRFYKFILNFY